MLFSLVSTSLPQSHLTTLIPWTVFAPRWSSYLNKQDFLQVQLIFHYITVLIKCKPFVSLGRSFVYLTAGSDISYVFEHFDRILSRLSSPIIMGFTGALASPLNSALVSWVTPLWMLCLTQKVETEVITLPLTKTDITEMELTSQSTKTTSSEKNVYRMKYLEAGDSGHYSAAILMICRHQMGMGFHTQIFEYVGPCLE